MLHVAEIDSIRLLDQFSGARAEMIQKALQEEKDFAAMMGLPAPTSVDDPSCIIATTGVWLFGTLSGGPVVNVLSTGVLTIPMMLKRGFTKTFAGGVEAAARSGGQIMPPVMGDAAFVLSAMNVVPYREVIVAVGGLSSYIAVDILNLLRGARAASATMRSSCSWRRGGAGRGADVVAPARPGHGTGQRSALISPFARRRRADSSSAILVINRDSAAGSSRPISSRLSAVRP